MTNTFYGKYRGIVTNIEDPNRLGRIRARVPDVFGDEESGWALPCAPFGGHGMGFFSLPKVDGWVWIEFEGGDPDYPIWSGCWWHPEDDREQSPSILQSSPYQKLLIKTEAGHSILLDGTQGTGGIEDWVQSTITAFC